MGDLGEEEGGGGRKEGRNWGTLLAWHAKCLKTGHFIYMPA